MSRWSWDVSGFEFDSRVLSDNDLSKPAVAAVGTPPPLVRRYSISTPSIPEIAATASGPSASASSRLLIDDKLQKVKDQLKHAREDYLQLRQEASDLREYGNAKLDRVTRYLGVLADRARKLDHVALESETRVAVLANEKKRMFNEFLTARGNIKVFCRARPLFEDEGPSVVEFPDEYTIRINTNNDLATNPKKDYEFDRVFGPHIGQGELFQDVQPFVQSALDGYNVSVFAYGQSHSGKTHTMEGCSQERGIHLRCFEELFDLSNSDTATTSKYNFHITIFELYNDQVRDLLLESGRTGPRVNIGSTDFSVELVQEKVKNPLVFSEVLHAAIRSRGEDASKAIVSHLIVTIHIHYTNWITRENRHSKLSLVDLPGSECLLVEDTSGDHVKDFLHVSKSLSALGDVLFSLTSKKGDIPYENSLLTTLLADSLGGSSKTLLIVNICPNASNLSRTLSTLNFSVRARNAEPSLGSRDTIKKWGDVANDTRRELYEKEKDVANLKQEISALNIALEEANDQCILLFNEVQKAWKVSFTLQSDLKSENIALADKHKVEKEQNTQLRNQVAQLLKVEQDQKVQLHERETTIQNLQAKLKNIESQLHEVMHSSDTRSASQSESTGILSTTKATEDSADSASVTKKLEEELSKRDALIEKLHEENEKLFDRLTEKAGFGNSLQVSNPAKTNARPPSQDINRKGSMAGGSLDVLPSTLRQEKSDSTALVKSGPEKPKTTPAGEYLTSALTEFDPDQSENLATVADGANKLLMLVLAAVIKAGAAREHEILTEIRDAVFLFIRKMEPRKVMDTMLVSRVRILYIRSLLSRSPELQSIKVSPVERFLEKANTGRSRSSSRGSSPTRSPLYYEASSRNALVDENHIHGFKVNIKQEKKSKFSSIVLKLRGIDQETWRQHVTGGKLREITEEAKAFAIGNKALAALFVHTPAGELQRQIRSWLAENFEFLSVTGNDAIGGTTGQLELISTAIMDGWMAGLGAAQSPNTDALGQLLSEYTKWVYISQLQHLKDIAGTLSMEEAADPAHVNKLRSALESVDHKRRKILQQMRNDVALLTKEEGGSPIRNPSTAAEDARLASLISLDGIVKQVKEIVKQASVTSLTRSKKKALLTSVDELSDRMSSLLDIDHPLAQKQIADACRVVECAPEEVGRSSNDERLNQPSVGSSGNTETEINRWNVLQFNTGSTSPFIVKCGANSNNDLVIKAEARVQEPKGVEIIKMLPKPSDLAEMSFEEIKQVLEHLPEAVSLLALARTADGTRARYSRLYRTLASKVPSLRDQVAELEKGGIVKDGR